MEENHQKMKSEKKHSCSLHLSICGMNSGDSMGSGGGHSVRGSSLYEITKINQKKSGSGFSKKKKIQCKKSEKNNIIF